jgi:hypothetical protein
MMTSRSVSIHVPPGADLVDQRCISCDYPHAVRHEGRTTCAYCKLQHPCADWKGARRKRWSWLRWRFEWGRYCFRTDCNGDTLESWFEPETLEDAAP